MSERASKRISERSGAREQGEQCGVSKQVSGASEQVNERTDERVAQYLRLGSGFFWTIVEWGEKKKKEKKNQPDSCKLDEKKHEKKNVKYKQPEQKKNLPL